MLQLRVRAARLSVVPLADTCRPKEESEMNARFTLGVIASLFLASFALASIALNSSRSNIYRVTYPSDLASPAQVKALLTELDKMGPADEAKLKRWLAANLRRFGIAADRIKKLIVLRPSKEMRETGIILLTNTADEAAAIAVTRRPSESKSSE